MFFPGRMSPEKTDFSWFRRLWPAEVCDACPTGRVRWSGKTGGCLRGCPAGRVRWGGRAGGCLRGCPTGRVRWGGKASGCLWGVPYRASPLGRKGRRMPVGRALPGESVGSERPADVYGVCPTGRVRWGGRAGGCLRVCPAGRVRWGGRAGGYLWGVPCRASPLGRKGRRIPMGCALPGESVGSERPADACGPVRWVGEAGGSLRRFLGPLWEWFSCSGPMFSFWEKFF